MSLTNKIQLGTYTPDGLRAGPVFPAQINVTNPNLVSANVNVLNYEAYGKGILYSPFTSYGFVPFAAPDPRASQDVVEWQAVNTNGYLELQTRFIKDGDPVLDVYPGRSVVTKNGARAVQFDYPRVPIVWVRGPDGLPTSTPVTIFGLDAYNFPVQMTYMIQNVGSFGTPMPYPDFGAAFGQPMKSMSVVTGVYVNGSFPDSSYQIAVTSSNIFGLPYALKSPGDLQSFRWADQSLMTLSGLMQLEAGNVGVYNPAFFLPNMYRPNVPSAVSLTYFQLDDTPLTDTGTLSYWVGDLQNLMNGLIINSTNDEDGNFVTWTFSGGGYNLVQAADIGTPSSFSGDPRGLFRLPNFTDNPVSTNTPLWGSSLYPYPNGELEVSISYFVAGANAFHNQLAASGAIVGGPTEAATRPVQELLPEDLYGLPAYYTGVPE